METITGTTLTNPNDKSGERFISVKLHSTNQEVKAVYLNPLNLDEREQCPNIKVGTEVLMLLDKYSNFFIMGSINQGISLVKNQIYRVENKQEVRVMSDDLFNVVGSTKSRVAQTSLNCDKIEIRNSSNEVIDILINFMGVVSSMKAVDTGSHGAESGNWSHDMIGAVNNLKVKLQTFKV